MNKMFKQKVPFLEVAYGTHVMVSQNLFPLIFLKWHIAYNTYRNCIELYRCLLAFFVEYFYLFIDYYIIEAQCGDLSLYIMRPLSLKGHDRALTRVRVNRDGDLLFSAGKDKSPCVWYTENGERIGTYDGHSGVIWDIDVSWDTKHLCSASGDGSVKVGLVFF